MYNGKRVTANVLEPSRITEENWRKNRQMEQEMQMPVEQQESEINLGDIFKALYKNLWILIVCFVVGALVGLLVTQVIYTYQPVYYGSFRMGVMVDEGNTDSGDTEENVDGVVIPDVTVTPAFLRTAVNRLDSDRFRDYLTKQLGDTVSSGLISGGTYDSVLLESRSRLDEVPDGGIETPPQTIAITYIFDTNTSSMTVGVSGDNETEVKAVSDLLVTAIPSFISYVGTSDGADTEINFSQLNYVKVEYENPNEALTTNLRNVAIAAVLVTLIGAIVIVVVHLLDNRIKDVEDVPVLAGVSVLGVIPKIPERLEQFSQTEKKSATEKEA